MKNSTDFARLVSSFLTEYLPYQRGYSKNTVLSYRDGLKIFIRYLTEVRGYSLNRLYMKDLSKELVISYLEWLRKNGCTNSTANQRLSAIKAFVDYSQGESIENMGSLQEIRNIKSKKYSGKEVSFLSAEEIQKLINYPDIHTSTGLRHRTIMTLLYDSGCRVQELCSLTVGDVDTARTPAVVRLTGKGNKNRTVAIAPETAQLVNQYLKRIRPHSLKTDPLIINRMGEPMDRDGVSYIIKKYTAEIRKQDSSFPSKVHCHMFRHSKAMHMLAADINIVYIRDFLGHEDVSTTMIYARADNRIKERVINDLAPKLTDQVEFNDWGKDADLMDFLNSLK